jgi:hypothetical protein
MLDRPPVPLRIVAVTMTLTNTSGAPVLGAYSLSATVRRRGAPTLREVEVVLLAGRTQVGSYPGRPGGGHTPQALPPGHSIRVECQRLFTDPANLEVGTPVLPSGVTATVEVSVVGPYPQAPTRGERYLSPRSPGPVPCLDW